MLTDNRTKSPETEPHWNGHLTSQNRHCKSLREEYGMQYSMPENLSLICSEYGFSHHTMP